jgi:hypothetical protein
VQIPENPISIIRERKKQIYFLIKLVHFEIFFNKQILFEYLNRLPWVYKNICINPKSDIYRFNHNKIFFSRSHQILCIHTCNTPSLRLIRHKQTFTYEMKSLLLNRECNLLNKERYNLCPIQLL